MRCKARSCEHVLLCPPPLLALSPLPSPFLGDIFVIESLDYETCHEFYLTVEATDGGAPPLSDMATVNINLTDVNDNSPLFSQGVYSAVVSEDSDLGKAVVTVRDPPFLSLSLSPSI